jgi:hypothetical protein
MKRNNELQEPSGPISYGRLVFQAIPELFSYQMISSILLAAATWGLYKLINLVAESGGAALTTANLTDLLLSWRGLAILLLAGQAGSAEALNAILESEKVFKNTIAISIGFGKASCLIFFAPIVLLFNYTKIPKNKTVGMLIPVAGILLIVLIGVQGIYQLVSIAPIPKLDGAKLGEMLTTVFSMMAGQ